MLRESDSWAGVKAHHEALIRKAAEIRAVRGVARTGTTWRRRAAVALGDALMALGDRRRAEAVGLEGRHVATPR